MAIAPNGNVVPCQSWLSDDGVLGSILKDSWSRIWNSSECKKKRKFSASTECKCPLRDKEGAK
jgi:radical SAM protein with 4Fe4S-binding SPASM domain